MDDLRIVLLVDRTLTLQDVEQTVASWLAGLIERHAHGLQISSEKTTAATLYGDERPVVRQSRKMARIQSGVSGGFDAVAGEEILDAVQGLIRSQRRYSTDDSEQRNWAFAPIPDVRDETVARFAAGRFRSTYRSLKPLLDDRSDSTDIEMIDEENSGRKASQHFRARRSQGDFDEEAKTFALGLIENGSKPIKCSPATYRIRYLAGKRLWIMCLDYFVRALRERTRPGSTQNCVVLLGRTISRWSD